MRDVGRTAGALLAGAVVAAASLSAAAATCDRGCLRRGLDTYLDALVRHDPTAARLGSGYRGTENGVEVAAGDGLWRTATGLGELQRRYLDPVSGQAAYYGLIDEAGTPAVAILRVELQAGRIVESEAVVARKGERLYDPAGVVRNPPAPDDAGPPTDAHAAAEPTRAALASTAQRYLDGMQAHSSAGLVQTPDCVRLESGVGGKGAPGSGPPHDCLGALEHLTQIAAVAHRRYPVIDTRAGVVVGALVLLRPPGALMPNGQPWRRNLLMDVFTVRGAALSGLYGATHYLDPADPESTGWPDAPEASAH